MRSRAGGTQLCGPALSGTGCPLRRARALAEIRRWLAEAQLLQGRHEEAARTVAELELFADEVDSDPLRAHACRLLRLPPTHRLR